MIGSDGFYSNFCPSGVITATRPRGLARMEVFDPTGKRVGNSQVELEGLQGKIHHTVGAELPDAVLQPVQMLDARGTRMPTTQKGPLFRRSSCRHIFLHMDAPRSCRRG